MDEHFWLRGIQFTWNAEKATTNESRHGVAFRSGAEAFFDPFFRVEDATKSSGEARQAVLGLTTDWKLLYVVFTETVDGLRLISARSATRQERTRYEDQ